MLQEDDLWDALRKRDLSLLGSIFYGVVTTGVFCRPGCPSRTPLRKNVRFYTRAEEAQADGLRACLRCKPLIREADEATGWVHKACMFLRRNRDDREALKLTNLGRSFGLSPFHFQRTFKRVTGITPRRYVEALRMEALKEDLRSGSSVTEAIYGAGFGSASRVYDGAGKSLGMTPSQYKSGGRQIEVSYATARTPLGLAMLGATDRALCFAEFGESEEELLQMLHEEFPRANLRPMGQPPSADFEVWVEAFCGFLEGDAAARVPVTLHGTAFQTKVWQYLQAIPSGAVKTYTEVAEAIGSPRAVRAVASACAANRIAVLVPCHRVIRGDGGLGGYRWGLERKRTLLQVEQRGQKHESNMSPEAKSGLPEEAASATRG